MTQQSYCQSQRSLRCFSHSTYSDSDAQSLETGSCVLYSNDHFVRPSSQVEDEGFPTHEFGGVLLEVISVDFDSTSNFEIAFDLWISPVNCLSPSSFPFLLHILRDHELVCEREDELT